ncbi:hypothetical protein MAR_023747, partial [Mya arenaria]
MGGDDVIPMGNTWLGMFSQERLRGKLPSVELVLRTCKLGIPRKEYIITNYDQNRNKTSKSKTKDEKGNEKVVETVPAEVHTQEVQRLEALCEGRTKQLNMVKLQLQSTTLAFDGMASTVNYLAHD